jgi:uncharacterized membrane protein YkoI
MIARSHLLAAAVGLGLMFGPSLGESQAGAQTVQPMWTMPHGQNGQMGGPLLVQARVLPVRQLIAIVQSQRGGAFVDVVGGLEQRGDRAFYVFRWRYPNGVEENLRVDASTGQVVG